MGVGRWGDWEWGVGRWEWGDGRWGDWEMGSWEMGETGRWGEVSNYQLSTINCQLLTVLVTAKLLSLV
jgi:hypothetical protein